MTSFNPFMLADIRRGIVTRDGWKYICLEHQPRLLFNLNDDPSVHVAFVAK